MICDNCLKEIPDYSLYCLYCGKKVKDKQKIESASFPEYFGEISVGYYGKSEPNWWSGPKRGFFVQFNLCDKNGNIVITSGSLELYVKDGGYRKRIDVSDEDFRSININGTDTVGYEYREIEPVISANGNDWHLSFIRTGDRKKIRGEVAMGTNGIPERRM
jgi:hypothetical protein